MTIILIAINVAVFFLEQIVYQFTTLSRGHVHHYLALSADGLSDGYVWQLLTFQFLHSGPWPFLHLLFNCLALYFFGREVENALGRSTFTKLYFLSGFAGGLLHLALAWLMPSRDLPVVGASAGVSGIVAAFGVLFAESQITMLVFFVIPVTLKAKYLLWVSALLALWGTVKPSGQVAHAAHLGGIIAGYCYVRWGMQLEGFWMARRNARARPRPRELVKIPSGQSWQRPKRGQTEELPPAEFISREVDPILDKISAHGIQSLTPRERQILEAARARMEKR
jgi:membrane associated rhomboid family serine protease